jgi:hypothetical protein
MHVHSLVERNPMEHTQFPNTSFAIIKHNPMALKCIHHTYKQERRRYNPYQGTQFPHAFFAHRYHVSERARARVCVCVCACYVRACSDNVQIKSHTNLVLYYLP